MPIRFSVSSRIPRDPDTVYSILADYRIGHPAILPRPPFEFLKVESGGYGEGTTIRVGMKMLGRSQTFRARVTEPEPGRVLVESNDTGYVTTFTVDPVEGGAASRVTIETVAPKGAGLRGWLEARLVKRMLPPIYERELERLGEVAGA